MSYPDHGTNARDANLHELPASPLERLHMSKPGLEQPSPTTCCDSDGSPDNGSPDNGSPDNDLTKIPQGRGRLVRGLVAATTAWFMLYTINERLWDAVVFGGLGLDPATRLGHAVHFFLYDTVKILLLIIGLIFAISLARSAIPPERVRDVISRRHVFVGFLLAAAFGAMTPFCSCSSVPLFIGFVAAGVPLGVTLTFLITSPLINQVGVVMLAGMVGWRVAALYVLTGMAMAILAGSILSRFRLERWIDPLVSTVPAPAAAAAGNRLAMSDRVVFARRETVDIVRSVWIYVVVGIAIGAGIHGWVPADFFISSGIADSAWSVPAATLAGVPLYANAAGVVPLIESLHAKGLGLGTSMSLMMSIVALSMPSMVMLKRVMRLPLLALFIATVTAGIIGIGFIFDFIG